MNHQTPLSCARLSMQLQMHTMTSSKLHRMRLEVRCFLGFARVAMPAQGHARCTAVTANTGYRVSATHYVLDHKNIGDPQAAADGGRRDSYS